MPKKQYRQRLEELFSDVDRLAADPGNATPETQRELDALRARLSELEALIRAEEDQVPGPVVEPDAGRESGPRTLPTRVLYEKDRVGYVYTPEDVRPLEVTGLPEVDSSKLVSAPLTASGQPIGKVEIEPAQRSLSEEESALLDAVARQASLQIQNLRLLSETERARTEAEASTRRFIHEGWDSYLDAIHQDERVGYQYDQASVTPYLDPVQAEGVLRESVSVMEEQVGTIYLKPDPSAPLTPEDKELVAAIAKQIAQQVENIRLLADAARARAEAEEATRRQSQENWKTYLDRQDETSLGFLYDSNRVTPLVGTPLPEEVNLSETLLVQGEPIGQLTVAGLDRVPPEAAELMSAVAARASLHLETLRLADELRKRAAELQELDRLKSSFLANMSHELRTPLNSILGFADVMLEELDGPLTENMSNDLGLIQKNGKHLLHLINDVLDMAKIESGRMNLIVEKFFLDEIFEEVTSITSPLASEKNLSLNTEPDSDNSIEVMADRTRLRQVMINLVNNSIKFTEKGKITIRADRQGDAVLIRVKDTGIGIPPEQLETIFQEFVQVDISTTRKVGGTGLGLPISRKLVEMHGGRLWAESTGIPGEGSTFYVLMPLEAKLKETE